MTVCVTCGNEYERGFTITTSDGRSSDFDSLECAIHAVAPSCGHCGCRVVGHGVEVDGAVYCCAHCARAVTDVELTSSV